MGMSRNFNYKRHHLLQVLEACRAWANFPTAHEYISKSGAIEAYLPGLTILESLGISNLDELEQAVKQRWKEYG